MSKNPINKNPLAWFLVVIALGWLSIKTGNLEFFIIFISAVILAKQIEILSR